MAPRNTSARVRAHRGRGPGAPRTRAAPAVPARTTRTTNELPQGLTASFWFDSGSSGSPHPVAIRFSGRRVGVVGPFAPGDHFVVETVVDNVVPGSGPVSITSNIVGVNAGEWNVRAERVTPSANGGARPRGPLRREPTTAALSPAVWSWRHWSVATGPARTVRTRIAQLAEFAPRPAFIPGSWAALVTLGVVIGFVLQGILLARTQVSVAEVRTLSFVVVAAGVLGGKLWYIALNLRGWRQSLRVGWCIQGALTGATAVGIVGLVVLRIPIGIPLDMTAPGLFLGIAVGRLGCFFSGCCAGRCSASRWAVWSLQYRVGARRVPTQLLESLAAMVIGLSGLVLVLRTSVAGTGALFVASFAVYTICRQLILRFRAEQRRTTYGTTITAVVAAVTLAGSVALIAIGRG